MSERVVTDAVSKRERNMILARHSEPKVRRRLRELGYHDNTTQMRAILRGELTVDAQGNITTTRPEPPPTPLEIARTFIASRPPTSRPEAPPEPEPTPDAVSYDAAARALDVKEIGVASLVSHGRLDRVMVDGKRMITTDSIARYNASRTRRVRRPPDDAPPPTVDPAPPIVVQHSDHLESPYSALVRDIISQPLPAPIVAPPPVVDDRELRELREVAFAFVAAFSGTRAEASAGGSLNIVIPPGKAAELFVVWARAVAALGLEGR